MSTILLPKTQHLVVFQEVIRSGSIGSAAKELGLTQPAVSKIINDIEDYFGVELVVRKNTGVTLTPAGQLLLSRSESITREMKNMVNAIHTLEDLAMDFYKQYQYNADLAPTRMQLQNMTMGSNESFKGYAQRWRDLAGRVQPPLTDRELIDIFMGTLTGPFSIT